MSGQTKPPALPSGVAEAIEQKVNDALKQKARDLRSKARWFCYGLFILITVILGSGLMTKRHIIVMLHEAIFGFDDQLSAALNKNVSVSYNNRFWLSADEGEAVESIAFYAGKAQKIDAQIMIKHYTRGSRSLKVRIWLNDSKNDLLWEGENDIGNYYHFSLEKLLESQMHRGGRPQNVHELNFELVEDDPNIKDDVEIRCLINVFGRESKGT